MGGYFNSPRGRPFSMNPRACGPSHFSLDSVRRFFVWNERSFGPLYIELSRSLPSSMRRHEICIFICNGAFSQLNYLFLVRHLNRMIFVCIMTLAVAWVWDR